MHRYAPSSKSGLFLGFLGTEIRERRRFFLLITMSHFQSDSIIIPSIISNLILEGKSFSFSSTPQVLILVFIFITGDLILRPILTRTG